MMNFSATSIRWIPIGIVLSVVACDVAPKAFSQEIQIGDQTVSLPPPTLPHDASVEDQSAAIEIARGKYPVSRFTKDSIVSPFRLERESIKNAAGDRIGHRIDLWFIAYGKLSAIRDQALLSSLIDADGNDGSGEELSPESIKRSNAANSDAAKTDAAKTDAANSENDDASWFAVTTPVLDRVEVSGVIRRTIRDLPRSYSVHGIMDDAFAGDSAHPNQWKSLRDESLSAQPYAGFAGHAQATELDDPAGALLIECHAVLSEPTGWFGGANLLGSKLPIAVQDAVRDFRRALSKHSK